MYPLQGQTIVSRYFNKNNSRKSLRVMNLSHLSVQFLSFSLCEAQIQCVVYILEHVHKWSVLRAVCPSCLFSRKCYVLCQIDNRREVSARGIPRINVQNSLYIMFRRYVQSVSCSTKLRSLDMLQESSGQCCFSDRTTECHCS